MSDKKVVMTIGGLLAHSNMLHQDYMRSRQNLNRMSESNREYENQKELIASKYREYEKFLLHCEETYTVVKK